MSGVNVYTDPDEGVREAEQHDAELERKAAPEQERGHGEGEARNLKDAVQREPDANEHEMSEDNDGGPPAGR